MYINIYIYICFYIYVHIYIYIYLFIYIYVRVYLYIIYIDVIYYIYIYQTTPSLEQNNQGQETFLAPSADNLIWYWVLKLPSLPIYNIILYIYLSILYIFAYIYIYIHVHIHVYIYIYIFMYKQLCIEENTGSVCKSSECWMITYQMSLTFNSACSFHIAGITGVTVDRR